MPATVYHAKTITVADGTATSVARPSDWNSAHLVSLAPTGQEIYGAFSNSGNVTFSTNTAGYVFANAPVGGGGDGGNVVAAGGSTAASTGTVVFSNSNGVSFGLNGGTVTASHNGLTTAAQSNHSHGVTLNLTNINGTTGGNSNGINLSLSAVVPAQTVQPVAYSAANGSANFSTLSFANSNGVSFSTGTQGVVATVKTDYLTTAAQSDHSHGNPTLALTNLSGTTASNSAGLTLSLSAAVGGGGDGYNIIGVNGGGTALSTTLQLSNSNNVSFGLNAGTITASASYSQSTQPVAASAANGSYNFSTLAFANSNGVSFSTGTQGIYATVATNYQSQGAYLTTARASNDAVGLNTALTGNGVAWTVNSSGISLNVPAFLTTAAQVSHSHGNPTLALTNITGTTASASNGLTLSLSGVAAQTTQTQPAGNIAGVGTTFGGTNVSGSMTLNSNGLVLSLSAPTPGGGGAINVSAGTTSNNVQTLQFNNANGVTFGLNGSTVTASVNAGGGGVTESNFMPHVNALWAAHQVGQNSIQVQPICNAPIVTYDRLAYAVQFSQATNSTMTVSATIQMGIYTLNGSTLSLLTSGSGSFSINGSGTASSSANSGPRWATMTLNAGGQISADMWVAFRSSTATAGVNASLSNICASRINSTWSGFIGVGTANSVQSLPGMGYYSATSAGMPSSMAISHITGVSSTAQRPQIFYLSNGAFVQ